VTRSETGLRERHKQTTRRALVDTALRLFDERGYGEVTVEDICAAVDVSPRTFFRYFPAKEHVLAEPITGALQTIRLSLAGQDRGGSVWTDLRAAVMTAAAEVEHRREEFLRAGRVIRQTPGLLASSARALMEWEQTVRTEVAERLGDTDGMYPRLLLGTTMLALRTGLDEWSELDGAVAVEPLVARALDALEPGARTVEKAAKSTPADH
jgi:AcrR family transcriptional regulator